MRTCKLYRHKIVSKIVFSVTKVFSQEEKEKKPAEDTREYYIVRDD
jgi:hypothetical protein